jgi:hypothetical protein
MTEPMRCEKCGACLISTAFWGWYPQYNGHRHAYKTPRNESGMYLPFGESSGSAGSVQYKSGTKYTQRGWHAHASGATPYFKVFRSASEARAWVEASWAKTIEPHPSPSRLRDGTYERD